MWENRIVGSGDEAPDQLLANPNNYRIHPRSQRAALRAILEDVGVVSEVIVNQRTGHLIDGHLRVDLAIEDGQKTIPVKYVDLSDEEELEVLATLDPLSAMAWADREKLSDILSLLDAKEGEVKKALAEVARKNKLGQYKEKNFDASKVKLHNIPGEIMMTDEERELLAGKSIIKVEYSGGIDSSLALVWAVVNFGPEVEAVHVDLGVELPGMAMHILRVCQQLGCGVRILRPKVDFFAELKVRGWPSWKAPWCQNILLHKPLDDYFLQHDLPSLLVVGGSNLKETARNSTKAQLKCIDRVDHYSPLFGWTKVQTLDKLREMGLPLWPGYALGFPRTCCYMCPGGRNRFYAALRRWFPGLFRELVYWEKRAVSVGRYENPAWAKQWTEAGLAFTAMADKGDKDLDLFLAREAEAGRALPLAVSAWEE